MHVISRKRLNEFVQRHPDSRPSLTKWYRIVKHETFATFAELKIHFPAADLVRNLTVFNISGNKFRLIAAIHYNRKKIYVRAVLTHNEYDLGNWKDS
jgi:mRNA interferase HigB